MRDVVARLTAALEDRYRIDREIGAGGMATVYLAHDIKHDRDVAIKVLHPDLGAALGGERFLSEIKTTAKLQHPHILPLLDSGDANGLLYYVMPFVTGETLHARLDREKQLPIDDAIRIARETADALGYAHGLGVVHRDIKPENILLQNGHALVADFGIALAVQSAGGARLTQTGLSLGTPSYMSPEQAMGERTIDARSDIYALGAVTYEMLAGEPPFTGPTVQAIVARVLTTAPAPVAETRNTVPSHVDQAVLKALAKLPADRFSTTREFAEALVNPVFTTNPIMNGRIRASSGISPRTFIVTTACLILLSAGLAAWAFTRPAPVPPIRARFVLEVPDSQATSLSYGQLNLAVAPNGTEIIYPGRSGTGVALFRRRLNDLVPVEIPHTDAPAAATYSPDGRDIVMQGAARDLVRIELEGGSATRLASPGLHPSWDAQGAILFTNNRKLWRIEPTGGTPKLLAEDSSATLDYAHFLPDGKTVIYNRLLGRDRLNEIWLLNTSTGSRRKLDITGFNPRYVRSGHILSTSIDGAVVAAPFDVRSLRVLGPANPVLDLGQSFIGPAKFDVSNTGVLVYAEGFVPVAPAVVDLGGRAQSLGFASSLYVHPRIAPGGDRIAIQGGGGTGSDIFILTRASHQTFRLTHDGKSRSPEWSPDGSRVFWIRADDSSTTLVSQSADGSGQPQTVASPKTGLHRFQVAPNGKFIAMAVGETRQHDIMLIPLDGTSQFREITKTDGDEVQPTVSPDGKWIAYASNEGSRRFEVYISSVDNPTTRIQVSTEGATAPVWMADGKTLVFCTPTHFVAAELRFSPRIEVAKRDTLFTNDYRAGAADRVYDYDPKTRTFLVLTDGSSARSKMVVATEWLDEVAARAPRRK